MIRVIRARPVGSENRTWVICEICGLNEIYCNLSVFVYPACPVKFFPEDERSGINQGSSGRWYWGDFVAELLQNKL